MSIVAMLLVAVSSIAIPLVSTIRGLAIPHFGLGLGIGAVDAALVPLLATLVDSRHSANYAVVYALQQTAVSLAYSLGPMFGGELAHFIGFPGLMRCVGIVNLLFCPLLALLSSTVRKDETICMASTQVVNYSMTQKYNKFNNVEDSD
ncbi:Synaptic vesicular amine [Nesidiocoris tenuis]|uniref:Synaptic vesicular amine n=1 Tax=Nesidiocoris tenuis TaxID=355587 RepID=A0ABN7AVU2_9HEMI|nr:Synaptic vesicular amine [Nesidiocoris tenuis]